MKTFVITGGIGSGKSTLSHILRDKGFPVIDADRVSRQVVAPGEPGLAILVREFGPEILDEDGQLDRSRMRQRVASDPVVQKRIGACLHPLIIENIKKQCRELDDQGHALVFVEAALTIESGSYRNYDGLILVQAPEQTRIARVVERDGVDASSVQSLIDRQMPDREKGKYADIVFHNDQGVPALKAQVETWLGQLL